LLVHGNTSCVFAFLTLYTAKAIKVFVETGKIFWQALVRGKQDFPDLYRK